METQCNEARTIEAEKGPHVTEFLNRYVGMINTCDPTDVFLKLGCLLGLGRRMLTQRTDYSRFLLSSPWICSGIFMVDPRRHQALCIVKNERASDCSAFFRYSLWTAAGVFTLRD